MTQFHVCRASTWRLFTVLVSVLLGVVVFAPAMPVHADGTIRVLTYNIRTGLGALDPDLHPYRDRKRAVDLAPIVAAIRATKADVVALQEVRGESQAKAIADALAMEYAYARHGPKYGKWWGLAVISRLPITAHASLAVSLGEGNTRSDLLVRLDVGGRVLTLVANHADKDIKDGSNHATTMANLKDVTGPLVLLGDFNARPAWKRLRVVRKRLADAVEIAAEGGAALVDHPTYRDDGKLVAGKRIDYIFVDANLINVRRVGLLDEAHWGASDHIGVFADLEIKGQ